LLYQEGQGAQDAQGAQVVIEHLASFCLVERTVLILLREKIAHQASILPKAAAGGVREKCAR
jgi:hypothetical protein